MLGMDVGHKIVAHSSPGTYPRTAAVPCPPITKRRCSHFLSAQQSQMERLWNSSLETVPGGQSDAFSIFHHDRVYSNTLFYGVLSDKAGVGPFLH